MLAQDVDYEAWTVPIAYGGAQTGSAERISALLCRDGAALYYGQLVSPAASDGTAELDIPAGLEAGSYTLYVFNEHLNGDKLSDFSSAFSGIGLTVNPTAYSVTVNGGSGGGDYRTGASVTITANAPEAGKWFAGWTWTGADDLTFTGGSAATATATFTMPASAVTLTATYDDIPAFGTPDFTLPAEIEHIGESAFEGIAATVVDIPEGCASIGDHAFKDCPSLTRIRVPNSVTAIGEDVFDGCALVFVFGAAGSPAQTYCAAHDNCVFVAGQ